MLIKLGIKLYSLSPRYLGLYNVDTTSNYLRTHVAKACFEKGKSRAICGGGGREYQGLVFSPFHVPNTSPLVFERGREKLPNGAYFTQVNILYFYFNYYSKVCFHQAPACNILCFFRNKEFQEFTTWNIIKYLLKNNRIPILNLEKKAAFLTQKLLNVLIVLKQATWLVFNRIGAFSSRVLSQRLS